MKLQNTFVGSKLNKDIDERLLPKGQYPHALNIRVANSDGSDMGAVENVKGNARLTDIGTDYGVANAKAIGSFTDEANQKIYAFITSDNKDLVTEYDRLNNSLAVVLIENTGGVLNFNVNNPITGVTKIINGDSDKDLLVWTDDLNSPKMVNIRRAIDSYTDSSFTEDDIALIKKPPAYAPTAAFTYSTTNSENFLEDKFISVAYRYKYVDGQHTTLSSFTNYLFAPDTFDLDYPSMENSGMVNIFNALDITFNTGGSNVVGVDLVYKESGSNTLYLIDSFNKSDEGWADNSDETFRFSNSKINTVLSDETLYTPYDNVPLRAKALDLIGNRLVFGNYVEGYDLVDAEENGSPINLDYLLSLKINEIGGEAIPVTIDSTILVTQNELTLDLTGLGLTEGSRITIDLDMGEEADDDFGDGYFRDSYAFILNRDFTNASDLAQDADFIFFIESILTNGFTAGYTDTTDVTLPVQNEDIADITALLALPSIVENEMYEVLDASGDTNATTTVAYYRALSNLGAGNYDMTDFYLLTVEESKDYIPHVRSVADILPFRIEGYTADTIAIRSPRVEYSTDYSPNALGVVTSFVWWEYETSTIASLSLLAVNTGLKSNRSYEVGVIYSEDYNRGSTTLTKSRVDSSLDNTINVDQEYSTKQAKILVDIHSKPPYWATKYKFAIKQSKGHYHTIYVNTIYRDGLYNWVKLEGESKDKVSVGDTLIVKADLGGALEEVVKVKVLELDLKDENFISENLASDGVNELIETAGLYMKIKPFGIDTNVLDTSVFTLHEGGSHLRYVTRTKTLPTFGEDKGTGYENIGINSGDTINIYIKFKARGSISYSQVYDKTFTANDSYASVQEWFDIEVQDLGDFGRDYTWDGVTSLHNSSDFTVTPHVDNKNTGWGFLDENDNIATSNGRRFFVMAHRDGTASRRITTTVKFQINTSNSNLIFETIPEDNISDIFYETSQTFDIVNGAHQGNVQNQVIGVDPAICELDFYNCFIQGNGAESNSYLDGFNTNKLNIDLRPNAVSVSGYKSVRRLTDLTYSESYNENTNLNGLSTFNLAKANYKEDIDKSFGSIQKVIPRDTNLLLFQESKLSRVLYGKDLLTNADGTTNLTSVESVLGEQIAYKGEFGVSNHPESVVSNGHNVYWVDPRRGSALRFGADGITEISKAGLTQWFKDEFIDGLNNLQIGGFDPYYDQYVIVTNGTSTLTFDERVKGWTSFHSFQPDWIVGLNNELFTYKDGDLYVHHSDAVSRNNYYGESFDSEVSVMINDEPSETKELQALGLEGNQSWDALIKAYVSNSDDTIESSIDSAEFVKKEGKWYAYARRNESDIAFDSKATYGLGTISGLTATTFVLDGGSISLTVGDSIVRGSDLNNIGIITEIDGSLITMTTTTGLVNGDFVVGMKDSRIEGGNLRGYTLRVDLTNSSISKVELFAVNAEVMKSFS